MSEHPGASCPAHACTTGGATPGKAEHDRCRGVVQAQAAAREARTAPSLTSSRSKSRAPTLRSVPRLHGQLLLLADDVQLALPDRGQLGNQRGLGSEVGGSVRDGAGGGGVTAGGVKALVDLEPGERLVAALLHAEGVADAGPGVDPRRRQRERRTAGLACASASSPACIAAASISTSPSRPCRSWMCASRRAASSAAGFKPRPRPPRWPRSEEGHPDRRWQTVGLRRGGVGQREAACGRGADGSLTGGGLPVHRRLALS
jgi:hypothetical protein